MKTVLNYNAAKKLSAFFVAIIITFCTICVQANNTQTVTACFGGLLTSLCETEIPSGCEEVPQDIANKIIKKTFGDSPFKNENVLNRDLVKYLSQKVKASEYGVSNFSYDYGLIDNQFRNAYIKLYNCEKLYIQNGFVNSNSTLTYEFLINQLAFFKDDILENTSVSTVKGTVAEISKKGNISSIEMYNTQKGTFTVKIKNLDEKLLYKNGKCEFYNRNIVRNDVLTVYSSENNIVFLSTEDDFFPQWLNYNDTYNLITADIYYIDMNDIILKNPMYFNGTNYDELSESYTELTYSYNTELQYKGKRIDAEFANTNLLDKKAYIICDKNKKAKFIYITE